MVESKDIKLLNGGIIQSVTFGEGQVGTVRVEAEQLLVDGENSAFTTGIRSTTQSGSGDAGDVVVESKDIELRSGGLIGSATFSDGQAGEVNVSTEQLLVDADNSMKERTGIFSTAEPESSGDAGDVMITAKAINMRNGGQITSSTFGEGSAGTIWVKAEQFLVSDVIHHDNFFITGIFSNSLTELSGDAGDIMIMAETIELSNGGINSQSLSSGVVGSITIEASENIILSNNSTISSTNAGGGNTNHLATINLQTQNLQLDNNASITTEALENADAGNINLHITDSMTLSDNSAITTESQFGGGGEITLQVGDLLHLQDSEITSTVAGGSGNGGNIQIGTLVKPQIVVLDNSDIIAQASAGDGGTINLNAQFIFQNPNSIIDASSTTGINGRVSINATDADIENDILSIDEDFIDASQWLPIPCTQRDGNKVSSLIYTVRDGTALSPNTLQTRTILTNKAISGPEFSELKTTSSYVAAHKPRNRSWARKSCAQY